MDGEAVRAERLAFDRPAELSATRPPEARGLERDEVRLLVSGPGGTDHRRFRELGQSLAPGDLLVVNRSRTLPASLPATGREGAFLVNLCTSYGRRIHLVEPRPAFDRPGPMRLTPGDRVQVGRTELTLLAPYPGLGRLWFVRASGDLRSEMERLGSPIRYSYVPERLPLDCYQTVFGSVPGSSEMASAGRPFTPRLLDALDRQGVRLATILLHTGVSSLEVTADDVEAQPMVPEPFVVPSATVEAIRWTRARGHRVIAVGTTVVRALESAREADGIRPIRGFTRRRLAPPEPIVTVDGIITGFHDSRTTHLALLYALAGEARVREAYRTAIEAGYLWHEFGDSHLLLNH
jgi:S-adenosylmethionine:tRNA ribosyltransferase-isomerase